MDTLTKCFLSVIIFSTMHVSVQAQNEKALQDAFASSYISEYAGDYTKAIDAVKKVYTEKSYDINLRLGWLYYMVGNFTESQSFYQKAIAAMPYSIEAKLGLINPASYLGNWDLIITQYKDILKIDPKNSTVNYKLGLIYYERADFTSAHKCFEQVVNLYPFDYYGTLYLGWTNFKLGKTREAKILFNKVLLIQPNDASALEGLSLIK